MLRAMTSVAEHLPQFLIPHLDKVFSPAVLPSFTIDEIDLVATLAEKVPSRQLLPASARALVLEFVLEFVPCPSAVLPFSSPFFRFRCPLVCADHNILL